MISIQINPNLRVDGDLTMADLDEDVHGGVPHGAQQVIVFEPDSGLAGNGYVVEVDTAERTVTLWVDWSRLRLANNARALTTVVQEPNLSRWVMTSPHLVA